MANREHGISLPPVKRASGFPGQRLVVVHPPQMARSSRLALLKSFFPTDIGSFRTATGHERRRLSGSLQTIFIYCTEGNGWCEIEGVRHVIRAENLLVIPSRCPHSYGASEQNPWSIEWFHAAGIGVDEIVCRLEIGRSAPVVALEPGTWNSSFFDEALSSLEAGFSDAHLIHASLSLAHLLGRIIVRQRSSFADRSSLAARLEKVVVYLRENCACSLNVSAMASMAGLSPSHFSGLFLKHTGHPPMDFLIRTRVGLACQLLDFTSLSVKEIAAKVGYSDPYYFSRIFKKVTASSPDAYRRIFKG